MVDEEDTGSQQGEATADSEMPGIDFSTFILSLGTSALVQMGVVVHPESGDRAEPDPLLASQTIDTLEMLHRKTSGNLDDEEKKLFDGILYEVRMRFVELTK